MTLSRFSRSFGVALLIFGVVAIVHFALQQHAAIKPSTVNSALYLLCVVLMGFGWVGLNELRALEQRSLVRTLQVIVIVIAVPMLLMPNSRSMLVVVLAATVAFSALPLALWHKHKQRVDRN